MSAYLITGRGGSGKTTICRELNRRGFTAFDSDEVPGLARAEDRATGQPTSIDWSGHVDYSKVAWNWNESALKQLINAHDPLFLCGSSSNQKSFHPLFETVLVLTLDRNTHEHRLKNRDSEYGRHPAMREEILTAQPEFAREVIAEGAIPLDATQEPAKIVGSILEYCHVSPHRLK